MFGQNATTAFVGPVADGLFPKIKGVSECYDNSFVGTTRAVMAQHMPPDYAGTVQIAVCDDPPLENDGEHLYVSVPHIMEDDVFENDFLKIIDAPVTEGDGQLEYIARAMGEQYPKFVQDKKVSAFFEALTPSVKVVSFLDVENHRTLLVVEGLTPRTYHVLQSAIPRFFPWFFTESKASAEERAILLSLCNRTPRTQTVHGVDGAPDTVKPGYIELMQEAEKKYDFRTARLETLVPDFIKNSEKTQMELIRNEIARLDSEYDSYERHMAELNRQRRDAEIRLAGMQVMSGHADDGGLMDWFRAAGDTVEVTEAIGDSLEYEIYTFLDFWDEDLVDAYIRNHDSDMYCRTGNRNKDTWEVLMRGIFRDRFVKIRTCAAYKIVIGDCVYGMSGHTFTHGGDTYLPNSHIQRHGCTGAYRSMMRDAMRRGDYVYALEVSMQSAKSMNFSDISFCEFIQTLADAKGKILQDEEGNTYTVSDGIKYLKKLYKKEEDKE